MLSVGAFFLTLSAAVDRRLVWVGPVFAAFAFAALLLPQWGYYIIAAANLAGPAAATAAFRKIAAGLGGGSR